MRMLLEQYVEGWKSRHIEAVLDTLANDCVVTECYGPVYKGRDRVRQWMETWFAVKVAQQRTTASRHSVIPTPTTVLHWHSSKIPEVAHKTSR